MAFFGSDWFDNDDDGTMVPSSWKEELEDYEPEICNDLEYPEEED